MRDKVWISIAKQRGKKKNETTRVCGPMVACLLLYTWPTGYRIRVKELHCPTWYGFGVVQGKSRAAKAAKLPDSRGKASVVYVPRHSIRKQNVLDGEMLRGREVKRLGKSY